MTALIIEDNEAMAAELKRFLSAQGYICTVTADGETGYDQLRLKDFTVAIVDKMLPGSMDGFKVARKARENGIRTPIIIHSILGDQDSCIEGLDNGADDYVQKSANLDVLRAHIDALLRRAPGTNPCDELNYGDITLNRVTGIAKRGERTLVLQKKIFELLEFFLQHPGRHLSKNYIVREVWGYEYYEKDLVKNAVKKLRIALTEGGEPNCIETKRHVGYILR